MGINIQATYYLQSVLKSKMATVLALLRGLIFSGILVYVLPLIWKINGVWWAMVITEFLVVVITLVSLRNVDKQA